MKSIQNEVSENKAELKEQLRIQKDRSRRNNIRVEGIEEDENETWKNTDNKLGSFLHDKLEITDELHIWREHTVLEEEKVSNLIVTTLPEQLLLSC